MIVDHLEKYSWCCDWLSLLNWIGALTLFLLLKSVRLRLRFETEVALYFYKSTIHPRMEYCCQAWAGVHSCYMQDCLSFTCCFSWTLGWLSKCSQFKSFLYVLLWWCSSELAQLVPFPFFFEEDLLVILIDCIIFLSPFLDVARISTLTVSSLAMLDSGIFYL